jgi:Rha family phage regulatory protein
MGPERSFPTRQGKKNPNQARRQAGGPREPFAKVEMPADASGPVTADQERTEPHQVARFAYQGIVIRDRDGKLNLTDMWKAANSPDGRGPSDWLATAQAKHFREFLEATDNAGNAGNMVEATRGRSGETWAHWQLGLAYAKYLSPAFHAWCNGTVRDVMEGKIGRPEELARPAFDPNDPHALRATLLTYSERVIALEGRVATAEHLVAEKDRVIQEQAAYKLWPPADAGPASDPGQASSEDTSRRALVPVVREKDGIAYATSHDVAAFFEKQHKHVLRDIDALRGHGPDLGHEADQWFAANFELVTTPHATVAGRQDRSFNMTRDGFAVLAMGFTGAKALTFKLAYIAPAIHKEGRGDASTDSAGCSGRALQECQCGCHHRPRRLVFFPLALGHCQGDFQMKRGVLHTRHRRGGDRVFEPHQGGDRLVDLSRRRRLYGSAGGVPGGDGGVDFGGHLHGLNLLRRSQYNQSMLWSLI